MSFERLSDDTALCLAATALSGKAKVTPIQRELLRAVAECELVGDIAREVLLPAGLVKRNLARLMAMGLVSLRDDTEPPIVPALPSRSARGSDEQDPQTGERPAVSAPRPRQDSGVLPRGEQSSQIRVSMNAPDTEALEQVLRSARTSSGDVVESVGLRQDSPDIDLDSDDEDWLIESQVDVAFERLQAAPTLSADRGGPSRGPVRVSPIVKTQKGARGPTGTVPVLPGPAFRASSSRSAPPTRSGEAATTEAEASQPPTTQRMTEPRQPQLAGAQGVPVQGVPVQGEGVVPSLAPTTQPIRAESKSSRSGAQPPTTQPIVHVGPAPDAAVKPPPSEQAARTTQPPITQRVESEEATPAPTTQRIEPHTQASEARVTPGLPLEERGAPDQLVPFESGAHALSPGVPRALGRQPIIPTRLMNASTSAGSRTPSATPGTGSAEANPTTAEAPWASHFEEVRPRASSPPPPRYSGIKGLGPNADAATGQWAQAVGDVGISVPKAPAIPRVRVPLPSDFDTDAGGLAGQTIPLVAVIRAPSMIETVRGMSEQRRSRAGTDSAARTVGSAKGAPSDPGGSVPNPLKPRETLNSANAPGPSDSGAVAVPADPRGGAMRFGKTLVGVAAPAETADAQQKGKQTTETAASDRPRSQATGSGQEKRSGTLLGGLTPTAERLGENLPVNDFQPLSEFAAQRLEAAAPSDPTSSELGSHPRASGPPSESPSSDRLEHYQVLECLAQGGSGVVYKVHDPQAPANEFLALKVLRQGSFSDPGAVDAFEHEAEVLGALGHPNVAGLEYFGRQNGEPFLLMQFVDGLSMSDLLHHPVPLPLDVGLIILQDALEALDYIHNVSVPQVPAGLVHCDISPQNLLVGTDGVTRVIDFGSARAPGQSVDDAAVRCKPRYSSPEMMACDAVHATSDVFSMGAVLFQVLSKQPAFSADPARRKAESLVPNPSMLNRRAPTRFDPICQRALDPDVSQRYQSARQMLEALDEAVELSSIELRRQRVNFWVRRVIQSRHGDVEFDINELEELLEDNGGSARARRNSLTPVPPGTMRQTEPEEEPDSSAHGAAARLHEESEQELAPPPPPAEELRKKLWLTSIAVGVALAIVVVAVLKPDVFRGWFGMDADARDERYEGSGSPAAQQGWGGRAEDFGALGPGASGTRVDGVQADVVRVPVRAPAVTSSNPAQSSSSVQPPASAETLE